MAAKEDKGDIVLALHLIVEGVKSCRLVTRRIAVGIAMCSKVFKRRLGSSFTVAMNFSLVILLNS